MFPPLQHLLLRTEWSSYEYFRFPTSFPKMYVYMYVVRTSSTLLPPSSRDSLVLTSTARHAQTSSGRRSQFKVKVEIMLKQPQSSSVKLIRSVHLTYDKSRIVSTTIHLFACEYRDENFSRIRGNPRILVHSGSILWIVQIRWDIFRPV